MKTSNMRISLSLIFLMIIYTFSGCTDILGTFEPAGEKDPVTIPKSTYSTLILDIDLGVGSITFDVIPTATYLVDVVNAVSIREGSDGTLDEAKAVISSEINTDTMKISFDSGDDNIQVDYKYDSTIKVANNISLQINFLAATGEIFADLTDKSVTVSSFYVEATTGTITLSLGEFLMFDSSPTVKTTTGNQDVTVTNLKYVSTTTWSITGMTGGINLDLTDNLPQNLTGSTTHLFNLDCTTGSIDVISDLSLGIGLQITASVTTGTIDVPGSGDSYTSPNFASSLLKYDFTIITTTGGITFTEEG
ncbi:hypothetical protein CEE45_02830 [Candidatus Heimdallarchaeota archaeon B3_Heim]|nr:MAG: hypothetical protein CEE45_02830 [Candidatus Heimdallarchaeota archaeon B3_Heim]